MGLDIVLYKKDKKKQIVEIKEKLHKILFSKLNDLSEMNQLNRIRDYYKTNVHFRSDEISMLVEDLKRVARQVSNLQKAEILSLIKILSDSTLIKIHITGD